MGTLALWVMGARLRTLPLALAPVVLGTSSAVLAGAFDALLFVLALLVAVSLQVGVNYANDYSDGVRGTDDVRVGPARLTGSGAIEADLVKRAAFVSFGVAGNHRCAQWPVVVCCGGPSGRGGGLALHRRP